MQDKAHLKLNTDRLICNYEKEISLKFFVEIQCVLRIALTDVAGRQKGEVNKMTLDFKSEQK